MLFFLFVVFEPLCKIVNFGRQRRRNRARITRVHTYGRSIARVCKVWLTSETRAHAVPEKLSSARARKVRSNPWASRWIYLYARRRMPLRHCLTVTVMLWESLPVCRYLYLPRSPGGSFYSPRRYLPPAFLTFSPSRATFNPLYAARHLLQLRVKLCARESANSSRSPSRTASSVFRVANNASYAAKGESNLDRWNLMFAQPATVRLTPKVPKSPWMGLRFHIKIIQTYNGAFFYFQLTWNIIKMNNQTFLSLASGIFFQKPVIFGPV